ncbi:MAG: phosphoribosylformylglycinamidine synthase subunit PurL [Candidatus Omnitrophica bacterium]|nr:phosphoribosylformylglycinamidine synthase subunit PurL [Candidatus Omnitrophota bacterium]
MYWRIEVKDKEGVFNSHSESLKDEIREFGLGVVHDIRIKSVYFLIGSLSREAAEKIAEEILIDSVIQEFRVYGEEEPPLVPQGYAAVQILYKPGVMDPVEESTLKGIRDLGITGVSAIRTAKKYLFKSALSRQDLLKVAEKLLYNKLIQIVLPEEEHSLYDFSNLPDYKFYLNIVDLTAASDLELQRLSRQGQLYLNLDEMKTIQAYFKKLKRDPTDCELETIAQTWSEHCGHKTFRGIIDYKEKAGAKGAGERFVKKIGNKVIRNLLKNTIMKATAELKKPYCVSVFKDNSGIIKFDEKFNVCFKVETHNHPSALEPYGGANTGIGGVIRDPMGTGLGAKPILNTDVFCFGPIDTPNSSLPKGALHPRRVAKGVVSGVRDYGNRMGIPTANGAVLFDERFIGNPLVYCGTVGILPKDKSFKKVQEGDMVVVAGGRTGRDGIHGATFSSGELTHESESISSGAVQIGNAITEKKMLDVLLKCRDKGLYDAITDCGAGGLSSAVGEMGQDLGARVSLDRVPLKYHGLTYTEIWISEAQERMVLAVSKAKVKDLLEAFAKEDVEAIVIGEFTHTKKLELFYHGHQVCSLDMDFLHDGGPKIAKKALWARPKAGAKPKIKTKKDHTEILLKLLSHPDIASKEWVIRQYDHEVQGATVIKPLVGVANDGPSDACVVKPRFDSLRGLAISNGINFKYGDLDPYWMVASCVDEALRQIIAVGGSLKQAAILDNFCWGNPDKPDRLGGLVRAAFGCYDASIGFGVPFISGKDSLYNEFSAAGKTSKNRTISIPGTLLISCLAVVDDVSRAVTMDLKAPQNLLYIVGETFEELGGSHYYDILKLKGGVVPQVDFKKARAVMGALSVATAKGLVRSAHDCSEGGLGVAIAEMCFAGGLGANVFLAEVPFRGKQKRDDILLFSESNSRFIVEVERSRQKAFEGAMKNAPLGLIGCVTDSRELKVFCASGSVCCQENISNLKEAWQKTLRSI